MNDHQTEEQPRVERDDLEAPDPPGNPSEHTSPRENPPVDPERLERDREDAERTIAS